MRISLAGLIAVTCLSALVAAQPAAQPAPQATITLRDRQASAMPLRQGFTHTGGGNIDVAQPAPDTVVVTMSGVAVAGPHPFKDSLATLTFQLDQCFEIALDGPKIKRAKLTLEGRVIGLLRSHEGGGTAQQGPAHAAVVSGGVDLVSLDLPSQCARGGDNLSVNDRRGPVACVVGAGECHLGQMFTVTASHPHSVRLCKAASAEFAPDPALDPLWISYWEPFHGAAKKDFGFQVTLKVAPETNDQ
jgi:hypothetical protein